MMSATRSVHQPDLMAQLTGSGVVIVVYPDGSRTIVRGDELLEEIIATDIGREVKVSFVPVAGESETRRLRQMLEAH